MVRAAGGVIDIGYRVRGVGGQAFGRVVGVGIGVCANSRRAGLTAAFCAV